MTDKNCETLEDKERKVKELIAERMTASARFLLECFLDTDEVEVSVERKGTGVVTTVAGNQYYVEAVEDLKKLVRAYSSLSNVERKEYGDRASMKMVFTILVNSYAGGHLKDNDFRQKEMLNAVAKRISNFKVVGNA